MRALRTSVALLAAVCAVSSCEAQSTTPPPAQSAAASPQPAAEPKPVLAEDVFSNIQTFKGKNAARLIPAMDALRGLLGVDCSHCHTPKDWANESKPQKQKARQHFDMIGFINREYFADANAVSCWTCHRGQPRPASFQRDESVVARVAEVIRLPEESREKPSEQVFKNIRSLKSVPAGRLPLIMTLFTTSLGVPCTHCHVKDQWEKDDKPEKQKARQMLGMATGIVKQYYGGNGPVGCYTCHQGKVKPELVAGKATEAVFAPPSVP